MDAEEVGQVGQELMVKSITITTTSNMMMEFITGVKTFGILLEPSVLLVLCQYF